ncbi:NO-inducible flavohemoprotein [Amphritea sp. 1_MG-2023]|uniref:NO-inducible flavohemoprotein n=1 Tax=Amphritea sp. 1_MG-2023 TaxID=3062670 RepID=UPI0026E38C15|nr:NO-inducible flavohemoprotein [Amphritea sp. 1_MG-2023]MDO6563885.1 NO-inducible flavohemoprotein [Amphritea sp. 1_MG-2023]
MKTETITIVKATVPAIQASGEAITQHFYRLLFAENPELQHVFNMASQASGRQQSTLAAAILGYAANIDNLGALGGVVEKIAAKHFSLDITPPQYDIVGRNLLRAIQEVLGDEVVTDAVLAAWAEAYQQLADILIGREAQLYSQAEAEGWAGFKAFHVTREVDESDEIRSFYLSPDDAQPLPKYRPGQFLSVKVTSPDWAYEEIRQYSLSDSYRPEGYRISVKRESSPLAEVPDGKVSLYLHNTLKVGSQLAVHMPSGDFCLKHNDRPVVLISGGVGVTPMLSMLNDLLRSNDTRHVTWLQGTRNRQSHAFAEHIGCLKRDYPQLTTAIFYDDPAGAQQSRDYDHQGYITTEWLKHYCPADAEFYFCGPLPFMRLIHSQLKDLGIDDEQLNYEVFGPGESVN